jgi:hypothetical protein
MFRSYVVVVVVVEQGTTAQTKTERSLFWDSNPYYGVVANTRVFNRF